MRDGPQPADSVRGLARRIRQRKAYRTLRGASDGGIRQYVEGSVTSPRIELLRAIADVLGVRWEWLASAQGAMTEVEERTRLAEERGVADALEAFVSGDYFAGLSDELGDDADRFLQGARRVDLLRVWRRLSPGWRDVDLGRAVANSIRAPIDTLGVSVASVPDDAFDDYLVSACSALTHLARAHDRKETNDG